MAVRYPPAIYVVSPGGRHATGGICRMVDNFMTEWEQRERRPSLVLVDSYGNKGKGRMPAYFAAAFWCVLFNGLCGRIGLLHLHMAECGSVLRKGMLVWLARLLGVPAVVHVHAAEFVDFYAALPRLLQRLVSATLRCATRCIVLGHNLSRIFHQCGGTRRRTRGNRVQRCPRPGRSAAGASPGNLRTAVRGRAE